MVSTRYRVKDDGELSAQLLAGEVSKKIEASSEENAVDIGVNTEVFNKDSNTNEDNNAIIQAALEQEKSGLRAL